MTHEELTLSSCDRSISAIRSPRSALPLHAPPLRARHRVEVVRTASPLPSRGSLSCTVQKHLCATADCCAVALCPCDAARCPRRDMSTHDPSVYATIVHTTLGHKR